MKKFQKPIYVTRPLVPDEDDLFKSFRQILDSEWLTNMGDFHQLLEKELRAYLNVPHVSIYNNGTIALLIAIKALNLPKGSEIITTPFTFAATPHVISWNGMRPVFVDIEPDTYTISPSAIEKAITPRTSAILAVHVYGFPCDVDAIEGIARKHDLRVIYDGAHAFSTEIHGKSVCHWGDITMLSFHATKLFNTVEGGALVYNNEYLEQQLRDLRNFGFRSEFQVEGVGINGKMNEFQAAFGLQILKKVKEEQRMRAEIYDLYCNELASVEGIKIPVFPEGVSNSFQYFPIMVEGNKGYSRDTLYNGLRECNVFSRKYFYPLCSSYSAYSDLPSSSIDHLPVATVVSKQALCLPFYSKLGLKNVGDICHMIREITKEN